MKIELSFFKSSLARYAVAIGMTVAALLLYQALVKLIGGNLATYIIFYPAVIITALFAGFGAGLLATVTAALLTAYWILPPEGFAVSSLPDAVGVAIFSFNGILISVVAKLYSRARQRAADYAAELALRDERKKAEEALRRSEERLRLHMENSPVAVVEWDTNFTVTRWAGEAENMFGWSTGETVGKPIMDLCLIYEEDIPIVERVMAQMTDGVTHHVVSANRNYTKDGRILYCEWYNSVLLDSEDKMVSVMSLVLDQTERRRAEMELKERTHQLENANKELESFGYSISHDLRAPLRAIDGYAKMILKQQGDTFDEKTKHQFDVIRSNAKMMGQLIDDLLTFSRLGRESLSISQLDMEHLTREAWATLKAINPDRFIDLKIDHMPPGMGTQMLIKQVLVNLLSNAYKFTRVREAPLVEVGGYDTESENVYYVRDDGVGFDMQYHDTLFGVFQRLHRTDEYEGTGIGLALVQRIINRHGGRVWAEGKVEEGACFYFSLPRG
jgi:PAS domain S-box-containing protein